MSLFRTPPNKPTVAESPALLFRDLKRDPSIKFLWAHQEKVLDSYITSHKTKNDLAIELPTGTGKTLIGLLIGEFRRQSLNERVVFLCSTKQLCAQVHNQAKKYGIPNSLLTGKQSDYNQSEFFNYQQGKSIAISTYSGFFNTNPRISDPHVVICDDAHSAETYISDMWTLRIAKHEHKALFERLFSLIKPILPDSAVYHIEYSDIQPDKVVELISPIAFYEVKDKIFEVFAALKGQDSNLHYPWTLLKEHILACNLYCTSDTFEFRPVLPPTLTHIPFNQAQQRIYMSATLGEDGDLERCFGVKAINRLAMPEGWDKRGTGRRMILFPSLSPDLGNEYFGELLCAVKRTMILVPNFPLRDKFNALLKDDCTVFTSTDAVENIESFRNHQGPAALILANRYDGIDFPGDECRSLIICGFPIGAGLQEMFFTQRLKALSIIRDRVRTRVTQAMGRCTRDESDYSLVLILGDDLVKWFCTAENIGGMHPELQAEISFGIENSTDLDSEKFLALCRAFLTRSAEWDEAEAHIRQTRATLMKVADAGAKQLQQAVSFEFEFSYALWNGRYEDAYSYADKVLSYLSGGEEMRAYRCFWQHQAAVAAFLVWKYSIKDTFRGIAIDRLNNASSDNFGIQWLAGLAAKLADQEFSTRDSLPNSEWFTIIEGLLSEVGLKGTKFDRLLAAKKLMIESIEADKFHQGLEFLGKMLGAQTHQWTEDGKPDVLWNFGFWKGFVFEAKTNESPQGAISITTVRQALTHEKSVRDDHLIPEYTPCYTAVISPRIIITNDSRSHANTILHISHSELVALFDKVSIALTELRVVAPKIQQDTLLSEAIKVYKKHGVFLDDINTFLMKTKLRDLPDGSPVNSELP